MAQTAGRRMAAEIDGDFVVFLIGMRIGARIRRGIGAEQHVHGGKRTRRIEFVAQLP